jgi:hypothetical protein
MNAPGDPADDSSPARPPQPDPGHLAGTYSPRWLSGPSRYEGLVATSASAEADDSPSHGLA